MCWVGAQIATHPPTVGEPVAAPCGAHATKAYGAAFATSPARTAVLGVGAEVVARRPTQRKPELT
jgi:hypothetical protein